jgi:branched-chain amino acid transport system permease protein
MEVINAVVQGVLLGSLYALCAVPLAISFGVMRIVNIATGDFVIMGAFVALATQKLFGMPLFLAAFSAATIMAVVGYFVQSRLLSKTFDTEMIRPLLATLGLSIIFQNGLTMVASGDSRKLSAGPIETSSISLLPGLTVGVLPLATALVAIFLIGGLALALKRTRPGMLLRAASDDPSMVAYFGIEQRHVFVGAMVLATVIAAIAGVLLGVRTQFTPFSGSDRLIFAFEVVILGGLGSLRGTLLGGITLGVAQTLGAWADPVLQIIAGHLLFIAVLIFRPNGLFGHVGRN